MSCCARLRAVEQYRVYRQIFAHQFRRGDGGCGVALGGVVGDRAIHREHGQSGDEVAAEINIDHVMHARVVREFAHACDHVFAFVVDGVVSARGLGVRGFVIGTHGGDHQRAKAFGPLHRVVAYCTCAAGDERSFSVEVSS